jgi:DNA-directed RNA polymerase sigma subunit (sigma70/sigma32)
MKLSVRDHKRDADIISLRDKGWTFTKIGKKYDISKARVRQLYIRVVNKRMGVGE